MYQLIFSNQTNLLPRINEGNVQSIHSIQSSTKDLVACVRSGRNLIGYRYQKSTDSWNHYWSERVFNNEADYPLERYPWLLTNTLLPNADVIILKHPDGIRFYQIDPTKQGLKLLKEDGNFHDVYSYTLLLGSFYPDKDYIGALTRDLRGEIQFYGASQGSFLPDNNHPLFSLQMNLSLTSTWSSPNTDIFVARILHNHQDTIGLRTAEGLEIYQFNSDYSLDKIVDTKQIVKPVKKDVDRIYFADLTHGKYRDILHLNNSGLFVYQYQDPDYKCLNHDIEFAHSVTVTDINIDKRDDIIFTGLQGITALSFEPSTNSWKTLLSSEQLNGLQQFATVISSISPIPPAILQPSIFTQDAIGKLQWAKIVPKPRIIHTEKPTALPKSTSIPTPTLFLVQTLVPEQIARTNLPEKPALRWLDQWSDEFLKEAVDPTSGQVHLNVPLTDTSATTNWGLKLTLSYDSRSTTTDLLGIGWSLLLAEDYIFVDYQGSVNPENTRYSLVTQGVPHLLKLNSTEGELQRFQLDEDTSEAITIQYDTAKEQWIIEGEAEKSIYGKADDGRGQDALLLSLSWPNWLGPGRDKAQQQSIITAWYLNTRFDKNNHQALYYHYEIESSKLQGGKSYSSALRLKTITDNNEMQLSFNYSPRGSSEYTVPNPIDDNGNIVFPVPLAQNKYLHGYNISTSVFSQELKFVYKVENGKRLLTAITQQLLSSNDPIMEFSYQSLLDKQVLKSCRLVPRGTTINFSYESLIPPIPTVSNKMISYPITGKGKIFHAPDYVVMAYRDNDRVAHTVTLVIMNSYMIEIDSVVADSNQIDHSNLEIKDFSVRAIQNSFVVFIVTESKRALFIFYRDSKHIWSTKPTVYSFSKKTLIRFGEAVIVVANPDKNDLIIFEYDDNQFRWNKKTLPLSRTMAFLAIHKQWIVGYDNSQLWLFQKSQSNWQSKILESDLPGLASMNRNTEASFDWSAATAEQVSFLLNQNGLQIFNNFILLSSLEESNGRIFSHVHLLLLDSKNNVVRKKSFKIARENLYQISNESKSKDGNIIYHMGYVKEDGKYKVRVKNVSGKRFNNIRNKNLRQDEIEKQIKHSNKDPGFIKSSKEYFLLTWDLYSIQISQYGAYCGNDTILRMTGTDWVQESFSLQNQPIHLGQNFILKVDDNNKLLHKLYKQDANRSPKGNPIKEITLHSPGLLVNRYPAYIAYQSQSDLVKMLTFKDEKTIGQIYTFYNEELLLDSDWQNFITVADTSASTELHYTAEYECRVRPISTIISSKPQVFVNQVMLTDGDVKRLIAYRHSFTNNIGNGTYTEKVSMIPGDDKNVYGWHEASRSHHLSSGNITKAEHWFNANGKEVFMLPKEKTDREDSNKTSESNEQLVLDRSGKWVISDFSPYKITDEMTAYYGFESYEKNVISDGDEKNVTNMWRFNDADIIRGKFAFTGESFLQLNHSSFLEGTLKPRDQETTYLVACWIRCTMSLTLDTPVPYLRVVINTTEGVEVIGLLGETKHQIHDWFYLELQLDFQILKQIYGNYVDYSVTENNINTITLPLTDDVQFLITIRVEAPAGETVDLDHIRFSPITHDFQAMVYHKTGTCTAVIQANGLIIRNIYNRLQQEIANTDEEEQLRQFFSSSKTGKLAPISRGKVLNTTEPNILSFVPESGFYETFDSYALRNRWQLDSPNAWRIAPGQLWHNQVENHGITPKKQLFDNTSAALRLYFALQTSKSSLSFDWNRNITVEFNRQSDGFAKLILLKDHVISPLPSAGELIIMLEKNYIWLWFDGILLLDQEIPPSKNAANEFASWSAFKMHVQGQVLIEDLLVINRPQVKVEYYNAFGEKTQVIQLEDTKSSLVTETLYDSIGREAITTKTTRITRKEGQPILSYNADFVVNKKYSDLQSVWYTDKLQGEVNRLNPTDHGIPYIRTEYASNPLSQPAVLGLPGPEFSVSGPYATKMSQNSDIAFLDNLFPTSQGYRQSVEHTPNGSLKVTVFDKSGNQVATYVRVPSYNHLLSTYEYDSKNRLKKILPPLYHEKVNTAVRTTIWQPGEEQLSVHEKQWQRALATSFIYDEHDRLTRKTTPESGITEYIYNSEGQLRFMVALNSTGQPQTITYYNYDTSGQLSSTGYFTDPLSIQNLQKLVDLEHLPNTRKFQYFSYADDYLNPLLRGRIKSCITYNKGEPIIDKLEFNADQELVAKTTITLSGQADIDQLNEVRQQYLNNKIHILTYPVKVNGEPLSIVHKYNKLGQLIALGSNEEENNYVSFGYHGSGELASEEYHHNQYGFTRNYSYNSPGFLTQIRDPFITEELTYTDKGYGQSEYSGMVMQASFNANWSENADARWFQFHEHDLDSNYSKICLRALKHLGYLTAFNKPIKLYIRDAETKFPLVCGGKIGRNIAKLVAEKQTPRYYGHRYAYGNHQELVKAKYFSEDTESLIEPLQSDSFAKEISNLTNHHSRIIWQLLDKASYIITEQQRTDPNTAIGKRGKSLLRTKDLHKDLVALNSNYLVYIQPIEQLIMSLISKQQKISLTDFETIFLQWQGLDLTSSILVKNKEKETAEEIGRMLFNKGYLPMKNVDFTGALDKNFVNILREYDSFIPQIVRVLSKHFAHSLGETPFDVESYDIDANGNHRLFYTGFDRYELTYSNSSNEIQSIKLETDQIYPMLHDDQGNVIRALHKGIQSITYHPVSQRTTSIQLTDGRLLRFYYDAQGERVLKRVFNAEGKISHETHYLRDEQGRVLVDRHTKYLPEATQEIVTAYLYGPRGLLGFFRNNNFFSVTTDHSGSIRLIMEKGKVVAANDYLPYGQLMRSYGIDPKAQIIYRYTGQEWDEETGLYNYHARLYDPSIGRFYQIDPKAQYFSPYKYAGNSPISTIDPDGEFAFLIALILIGIAGGAYLGGAAANNRWNPADWDGSDPGTYLGVFGGAVAGALLPVGFAASAGVIGTGATILLGGGGAYLGSAAANQNWNPMKWQWDRPHTWNGLFQGFGSGSGIAGGIGLAHSFANTGKALTAISIKLGVSRDAIKVMFLGVSYTASGALAYGGAVLSNKGETAFWKWDWSNPATWSSLIDGFDVGMGWPQNFLEIGRGISKLKFSRAGSALGKPSKMTRLKTILKNPKHPLYKTTGSVVMAYLMGSAANSEFDITRWSLTSFSTYEGVINGIFFGKDTSNLLQFARRSKTKLKINSVTSTYKNMVKHWTEKFSHMLDNIQVIRKNLEYQLSMEQLFSSDKLRRETFKTLLKDGPLLQEADKFFKGGLEKWQKGEIQLPGKLKHLILQEVEKKINENPQTQKLIEWRTEEERLLKKQEEVFPDRDVEFLNCHSISRRRKRMGDLKISCGASSASRDKLKAEISEQFFYRIDPGIKRGVLEDDGFRTIEPRTKYDPKGGFDSSKPVGFAEHFSLILRNTPTDHAPSEPGFFQNFILGSLYTAPTNLPNARKDTYIKIETVDTFLPSGQNTHKTKVIKIFFKEDDGTVILKTFIFEEHGIKSDFNDRNKFYKEHLVSASKFSKSELAEISTKLDIDDNYKIEENILYITSDNSLSIKELSTTRNNYQTETTGSQEFHKIEHIDIEPDYLENLSSHDVNQVKAGTEAICQDLMKVYKSFNGPGGSKFGTKTTSEAAFHGFVYGALSLNFKYRYHLDIHVERIAGRGYADLLLLSRKDNSRNKNWEGIPIIVEFKADKTSASSAIDQIRDTGYLYNLSLRTTADQAIIVGINPNIDPTDVQKAIDISTESIPLPNGFVNELMKNINDNTKTTSNIEEELKHLYYSISPLSMKNDKRYFRRLILGEFLSMDGIDVHVHEATDGITSFVFKKKDSTDWTMLNVIDDGKIIKKLGDKSVVKLPNHISINRLTKIDISVNHNTKGATDGFSNFLKPIHISDADVSAFSKTDYTELNHIDVNNFFIEGNIEEELHTLSKTIRELVNSESDFQAIFHGIFLNNLNKNPLKTIKVLPEANFSKAGRLDLIICQRERLHASTRIINESVLIMELKYAKNHPDRKLKQANEQILKYINNKSVTDSKTITPITIVFNKVAKNDQDFILYEIHSEDGISHTSGGLSGSDFEGDTITNSLTDQLLEEANFQMVDLPLTDFNVDGVSSPKKKLKTDHRRGRSINYTREFENMTIKNDFEDMASSGASNRLQFWPISLIKSVSFTLSSNILIGWISNARSKQEEFTSNHLPLLKQDLSKYQPPLGHNKPPPPSLLQMGDQWYQQSDMHGLLNLGILLVRKWTGHKEKSSSQGVESNDMGRNIQLDIKSTTIVDNFINVILEHAQLCEISSYMSDILEDTKLYYGTIKRIREKFATGELENIPLILFQELVQNNIKKLVSISSQEQIDAFLIGLTGYIPDLEEELLVCEQASRSDKEDIVIAIPVQATSNAKKWDNVDILTKTVSSTQKFDRQCPALTTNYTSLNDTEIFTNDKIF